jgi:hypothetical protein
MSAFTTDSNGINTLTATPTGDAGIALNGNFAQISSLITTANAVIAALQAALSTHAALTAAHGATGAVVGTSNTQTLTHKTLDSTNSIAAAAVNSGTIATARLGTGTANGSTFLAGDQSYKSLSVSTLALVLGAGNNAGGQSITNIPSLVFSDSTTQETAYPGLQTISTTLSQGPDAGGFSISNLLSVTCGSISVTGALADGTYSVGSSGGSITITNGVITNIT